MSALLTFTSLSSGSFYAFELPSHYISNALVTRTQTHKRCCNLILAPVWLVITYRLMATSHCTEYWFPMDTQIWNLEVYSFSSFIVFFLFFSFSFLFSLKKKFIYIYIYKYMCVSIGSQLRDSVMLALPRITSGCFHLYFTVKALVGLWVCLISWL